MFGFLKVFILDIICKRTHSVHLANGADDVIVGGELELDVEIFYLYVTKLGLHDLLHPAKTVEKILYSDGPVAVCVWSRGEVIVFELFRAGIVAEF